MLQRDFFRNWISYNLAPVIFLASYFFTIVLGCIIYTTSYGRSLLMQHEYSSRILDFETIFTFGFWVMLLMPFVITPLIVIVVKKIFISRLVNIVKFIPEISKLDFIVVSIFCICFVFYSMYRADAFLLFSSGLDAVSSVEARFVIRDKMGFPALIVLMSILHFLSIYAFIRWMLERDFYWGIFSVFYVISMTMFLVLLNMKWPLIIFYAGLILAIFVYSKKYTYSLVTFGCLLMLLIYFFISSFVFRLSSVDAPVGLVDAPVGMDIPVSDTSTKLKINEDQIGGFALFLNSTFDNVDMLIIGAVNRMAIIYPYYYEVFSLKGPVCGGVMEQMQIGQPCRPSTYIYTYIFGIDGFEGRGTSPASVHVSGYALGGWGVALFSLIAASIILGLFVSLPLDLNAVVGAFAITGGVAGYHFSQLPGEGPLFYDHGFIWPFMAFIVYMTFRFFYYRLR